MESELPILLYLFSFAPYLAKDGAHASTTCQVIVHSDTDTQLHLSPKSIKPS